YINSHETVAQNMFQAYAMTSTSRHSRQGQTQEKSMQNRITQAALLGLGIALVGSAAQAQQTPSAQQIINALKPTGTVSDTTRGIRPLPPGPGGVEAAPMATKPMGSNAMAPMKPQGQGEAMAAPSSPSVNLNVDFQSGSAQLTPHAMQSLDQLGQALTSSTLADYRFKIVGHTDTVGTPDANKALSEARAQAVESYLESKFNVPAARLAALGVGESDLMVKTPPQTPDQKNRRVEIINLGH
ncbi:MAG TPA: OmpA family protein, partial [Acetobacteraceae bacterium]|nr:OmpA family protein [Acetobacteraceae bacterium]